MFFLTPLHGSGHAFREEEEMARGFFTSSHKRIVPAARDMIKICGESLFFKKFMIRVSNFEEDTNWVSNLERTGCQIFKFLFFPTTWW
jgi:hypothetical protein